MSHHTFYDGHCNNISDEQAVDFDCITQWTKCKSYQNICKCE